MKIGIDASCWANRRGYGRYTRELLTTLLASDNRNQYRLFLDSETARISNDLSEGVERVIVGASEAAASAASASGRRSVRDLWAMRRAVQRHGRDLDIFYFPSVYTFFPIKTSARVIVTIHDTTAERYPQLIFPNWRSRLFWKLKVQLAVRRADLIATVSHASRREIMREFGVSEDMVRVVPDAVGGEFYPIPDKSEIKDTLAKYGVNADERFILYVGGISPHKNLQTLVDAHASLIQSADMRDVKLVLVGDYQQDVFYSCYADLCERINALNASDNVTFTGFVHDADLVQLYNGANTVVMPSFDEGFGLPALEAMACGTPVVASNAGALPEVVGDAGLLFNPHCPEKLRECLARLLSDPKLHHELGFKGFQRAKQFSWENSALSALAVFDEAARRYQPVLV
jgi:glycosyltransferase involved in cell wall biosynthesis